jgi:hypothetical protein
LVGAGPGDRDRGVQAPDLHLFPLIINEQPIRPVAATNEGESMIQTLLDACQFVLED